MAVGGEGSCAKKPWSGRTVLITGAAGLLAGWVERELLERGSAARARHELGWRPRVSVDAGLLETIAWYRTHLKVPA